MTNILGIAGSLRLNSYSTRALKLVLEKAATKYASETNLIDLREMELPIYNPNISSESDKILAYITREVIKADSYVLGSPDLSWLHVRSNEELVRLLLEGIRRKDIWIHRSIA
jgi:NAD(P)H-dependent FMN reductase